ncbi:MAG TPA: peroxiredoxin family protein [Chloroflexota bacterium]|nr:peroxiredoxin family protein [Chloroflexota bacterium]
MQLVELQAVWPTLEAAGVALYAISYDAVATLAAFAEKRGITYPLLSDEGSRVIRALGLLNEHLADQHAVYGITTREEQHGVAYPGTFVLDDEGVIVAKHFEQSYRVRPTAALFREFALGGHADPPPDAPQVAGPGVEARAWTDAPTYRPYQQVRLHIRLDIPTGSHLFGAPAPEGYSPLRLEVDTLEGMTAEPPVVPAPHPFRVEGLDDEFVVHEGRVEATIPLLFTSNLRQTTVRVRAIYQACSPTTCLPPAEVQLAVPLEGLDLIRD